MQAEKSFPFDFENMRNTLLEEKDHKQSRKPPLLLSPELKTDESSSVALLDERKRVSSPTSPNLRALRHGFKVPPSPPYVPVVAAQASGHRTLHETRSWDPNMPPDLNNRQHLSAPSSRTILYRQDSDEAPVHAVQKCKLRNSSSLPSEPKPRLRPVRSFDTYSSDQDGSHCDLLHPNNNNNIAPSPATKRRLNYLQKLAASMRPGSRSSSPSGSSRRSTMSSSQDGDSPCPSPGPSTPDRSSDEGGFDAFPTPPSSPSVMHKGRLSTSPEAMRMEGSSKFMPRKIWRSKSKSSHQSSSHQATFWNPEGNCRWQSVSGRKVQLTDTPLQQLSELEKRQLQKIAHQHLQNLRLGPIIIPKDPLTKRHKKGSFLRGRHRNNSFLDSLKDLAKDGKESGNPLVFGIPLEKCISNDAALKRYRSTRRKERRESLDLAQSPLLMRQSGKPTKASDDSELSSPAEHNSPDHSPSSPSATLLDALSLSTSTTESQARRERRKSLVPREQIVPLVVNACFEHIEKYGLRVLGIFRHGGSKKRTRQLREDYDSGKDIHLNESHNPHDVCSIIKEFFRDLPEPLLTRELYPAFVAASRLDEKERQLEALQLLTYLLPTASRDTFSALLTFLKIVSKHSMDGVDDDGNEFTGNKMDIHNLATLFGPNILRKTKGGQDSKDLHGEASDYVEESRDVIGVVEKLIDFNDQLFQVPGELLDNVLRITHEIDPEALDYLINLRAAAAATAASKQGDNDKGGEADSSYAFLPEDMILTPPVSPSPDELLLPYSLRGHEQRLFSSPDDMQAARSHQDDPTLSHSRSEAKVKGKSSSLPRSSPSCHFPSSPKIARCDDDVAEELNRQGMHSRQSSEDDDLIWMELHPPRALSPRHIRGLSNEKQIFTPSSPNSQRRISSPVSPLATRPPERQLSSPATCTEGGFLSPKGDQTTYAMRFTSRSPRLVRRRQIWTHALK
ncbi:LOW QUALITY PROTEIN: uncharacterized protein [Amphiura filiformis]|uniref:LOW QUALITY PROTEIN: uncharacterized protein n=1 Tax=Amphiura filiformis TaxID=82378 RepID=UPI003B22626D